MTYVLMGLPLVCALPLALLLGYFRLGDANADVRRNPPWSATLLLVGLAVWIAQMTFNQEPLFDTTLWINGLSLIGIAVGLAVHHVNPRFRGRHRSLDPSAYPAVIAWVIAGIAGMRLAHDGFDVTAAVVFGVCVLAQAQFTLFIYRKWRPVGEA